MSLARLPLFLLAGALCSASLKAQDSDVQVLNRRVDQLERRVAELERQLQAGDVSAQSSHGGDARVTPGNWKQLGNWRRLHKGMTMEQVSAMLGEPDRVDVIVFTIWTYGDLPAQGTVTFDPQSQKLEGWREPHF